MKRNHFERFFGKRFELISSESEGDEIMEGFLISMNETRTHIPIRKGIPRFVEGKNYADSFGFQWNRFRSTQLDSHTGKPFTSDRFWKNTKWKVEDLHSKTVLEVGSGAGRFTEIFLQTGAKVVSFDFSNAVDANLSNNSRNGDLFLFQGDLFNIPFNEEYFDFVFCYGVLQHTPDPERAFAEISKKLKPGGRISIDIYHRDGKIRPWKSKYLWRPVTTRMNPERLHNFLRWFIPKWLPFDTVIKCIPVFRNYLGAIVPCWNYFYLDLPKKMKVEWAIMDTFDALAAKYDIPVTLKDVDQWFKNSGYKNYEVFKGGNGIVGNGTK